MNLPFAIMVLTSKVDDMWKFAYLIPEVCVWECVTWLLGALHIGLATIFLVSYSLLL